MDPYQEDEKADDEFRRAWLDQSCRLAPDMIWEKFRQAPDGVWTKDRLYFLQAYVLYLGDMMFVPTKKDYKRLETHIVNNEDEPNIFRAHAALCLGFMYYNDKADYEEAAECFRNCIEFCDSASPEEKERVDEYVMLAGGPPRARQLSEVFDKVKESALTFLRRMEICEVEEAIAVQDPVRSPWCVYPRSELVPIFGDIPTEQMERRMASGGATCDCCGIARGSTDRKSLLVCSKCNMAYYCSKECQVEQWKRRGHKKACRKPREFQADDIVRYSSEDKAVVLRLKRLVDGEDGNGTPRWGAYFPADNGELLMVAVDESELQHIRPADIV